MRLFLQEPDDAIVINHHITVTVDSIEGDEVRLLIEGPPWTRVDGSQLDVVDGVIDCAVDGDGIPMDAELEEIPAVCKRERPVPAFS